MRGVAVLLGFLVSLSVIGGSACSDAPLPATVTASDASADASVVDDAALPGDSGADGQAADGGSKKPSDVIWAMTFDFVGTGAFREPAMRVASDANGNALLAIQLYDSLTIDGKTYTSKGENDVLVAKVEPSKKVAWVAQYGTNAGETIWGMTADPDGNVYVTGTYWGPSFPFDATHSVQKLRSNPTSYVAKLAANDGTPLWVKSFLSEAGFSDACAAPAFSPTGIGIVCPFYREIEVDTVPVMSTNAGQFPSALAAMLDPADGHVLWYRLIDGASGEIDGRDVAVGSSGDLYVTGWMQGGTLSVRDSSTVVPAGAINGADAFVVVLSGTGAHDVVAAKRFGTSGVTHGLRIVALPGGKMAMSGTFSGEVDLAGSRKTAGVTDGFVAILDASGSPTAAIVYGGTEPESPDVHGLSTSASRLLFAGQYGSTGVAFGGRALPSPPPPGALAGSSAGLAASIDAAKGTVDWVESATTTTLGAQNVISGIAATPGGDVLYTGVFRGKLDLGTGEITTPAGASKSTAFLVRRKP